MALLALFAFAFTAQSANADVVNNPGAFTAKIIGGELNIKNNFVVDMGMDPAPTVPGTVDANGNVSIPTAGVVFPTLPLENDGTIYSVDIRPTGATSGWTGNINPSTGVMNLNASMRVQVQGGSGIGALGNNCYVGGTSADAQVTSGSNVKLVPATTETEAPNAPAPGMTGTRYDQGSGLTALVNNRAAIAGAGPSCALLNLGASTLNNALGLPSTSGNNQMTLELEINRNAGGKFTGDVVPVFDADPLAAQTPALINFDASDSISLAGDIRLCDDEITENCGYQWDFDGNGTTDEVTNTVTTSHTYNAVGYVTPKLTICDEFGLCSTASGEELTINSMELDFTSTPPALSNNTTASFGFESNVEEATFECSLDGAEWASCVSPQAYEDLADGAHNFRVRGILDEEASLPIAYNWQVETAAPVVTFGGGSPVNTNSATSGEVSWTATDANPPVSYECRYDSSDPEAFEPCESPVPVSWPAENGEHSFDVRATDSLGNSSVTTRSWGFNNTPIVVTWTSAPVAPYINAAGAVFTWEADKPGSTLQCRKNATGFANCNSGSTGSGSFSNNANNSFSVRAIDSYGNVSNELTQSFYYDTSVPGASSFSAPANNSTVTTNTVTLTFSIPTGGSPISQECSIDGGTYSACSSPWTTPSLISKGSAYVFRVRNRDAAGNVQTSSIPTRNVTVNAPPVMTITGGPEEGSVSESPDAQFTFTADRTSGSTFECSIDGGDYSSCASPVDYSGLSNGEHTFAVRGIRDVGTGQPATRTWTVDSSQPFDVAFDHGLVTFGIFANINAVPEGDEITLSGEFTDGDGNFAVPVSGAVFPTVEFDEGVISGTVSFAPTNTITGKFTEATGRLAISAKLRARVDLDTGATCWLTRPMSFASNAAGNGWQGVNYTDGLDGDGAVVAYWNEVPAVTGDPGCSDLTPYVQGPGGLWLGSGIDAPPGSPINIAPPTLTGTGIVGGQLKCAVGEWSGASSTALQWTRNGEVFPNVNGEGKTKTTYVTGTEEIGDEFACQQVATNAAGSTTQASNSLTIAPKAGPVNIAPPTLTGTGFAGGQLKCAAGVWESGTYSSVQLQWTRNGEVFANVNGEGKTKTSYVTNAGDIGDEFACQQVATKSGNSTTAASNPITIVPKP